MAVGDDADSRARGPEGAETLLARRALHGCHRHRHHHHRHRRSAPYRRFGLRWRGRLDATSREYLTPSPRHQPAAAPWPAAVGSYSTSSLSLRQHAPGLARSLAHSLAQTIAPSSSPRPRSFSHRHLFRRVSPKPPTLSFPLSLSLALSASLHGPTPGVWYPPPPLSLFVPSRRHPRRQPPSRCRAPMTVAVRRTREGEKEARVTPVFWLGIVTGRPAYIRVCGRARVSLIHVNQRESAT